MAKLLDTSFLIAYHNKQDEYHKRAREIQLEKKVINEYVYAEVLDILYTRKGKKKAVEYAQFLNKATEIIQTSQPIFNKATENFQEKNLSFTDATIAATAQKLNMNIASFDQDFDQFQDIKRIH